MTTRVDIAATSASGGGQEALSLSASLEDYLPG